MNNVINLFTDGEVVKGERTFTRLVGGFNDLDSVVITKQIAELLEKELKHVNEVINRNIDSFEYGLDILDLKAVAQNDHNLNENDKVVVLNDHNSSILKSLGYSNMAISKAKNIYILSKAGFLLYLKFAEGDKAVEVYKDFLEDYFKTKAQNEEMKNAIEITLEQLHEEKAMLYGKSIMAKTETERLEILHMLEQKNEQIIRLEKSKSEKELVKKLESKLHMSDLIENGKSNYDIAKFAKILNIQGLGRNKLFDWLRDEKLLMKDNSPYQNYMNYFAVIPVVKNGITNYKTLLKPKGVDYVMKRLIKDGKVFTKSVDDVLKELEGIA